MQKRGIYVVAELLEYIKELVTSPSIVVLGTVTLIEIAPIKVNPWQKIFTWFSDLFVGELKKELQEFRRDFEETKAQDKRWFILNFANSCRRGERHSREEWKHAISEIREYEEYTEKKNIVNGVIEEDSKYLRELYHERNVKNDYL